MALSDPSPETTLQTQVCVIGSGPAGIACALELARRRIDVILVEAGGTDHLPEAQAMCDAEIVDPRRHAPMHDAVRRALGGTSWLWGGRCLPFDPIDFEPRDHVPDVGWPVSYAEIAPWYRIACEYANCGRPTFTLAELEAPSARQPLTNTFQPGAVIASDLERWSGEPNFARRYAEALRTSPHVRLLLDATCVAIDLMPGSEQIRSVGVVTGLCGDTRLRIRADRYVLACGGLESTRLLLNANLQHNDQLGNRGGMLGCHYMGHVSGKIASVRLHADPARTVWHFERDAQGFYARRRLTVPAEMQHRHGLLNTAMWLDNPPLADPRHGNGLLSMAYLALRTPGLSRLLAAPAIARLTTAGGPPDALTAHLRNVARALPKIAAFVPPFAYRHYLARPRLPGFMLQSPTNLYALHYHAEQLPHRASRVTLADSADRHGMRRLKVDLRFQRADAESVVRGHALLDRHLRDTGAGQLDYWTPASERVDAVLAIAADGFHQIGTARMAADWRRGVVNRDCRVFGTRNLYVASSAVFPTSSQANPTLTILALAARLAHHLAMQLENNQPGRGLAGDDGRLADATAGNGNMPMAARTAGGAMP
ncbi:FAD-dependent oxidoreductase [Cupriavidus sp. D384]|uniref:FAD-dependent oxidoreductase n=1 Tax=Cupriavidus sp. D384 TaxID=1538095 RepID=UPI00082B9674|nr:GMC family oxidoreductase [Cupriavidus sp. D384]